MRCLRVIGVAMAALTFAVPVAVAAPRSPLPGWLEQMIGEAPPAMRQQMRSPQMLQMMLSPEMQQMMATAGTMKSGGPMQGMMGGR